MTIDDWREYGNSTVLLWVYVTGGLMVISVFLFDALFCILVWCFLSLRVFAYCIIVYLWTCELVQLWTWVSVNLCICELEYLNLWSEPGPLYTIFKVRHLILVFMPFPLFSLISFCVTMVIGNGNLFLKRNYLFVLFIHDFLLFPFSVFRFLFIFLFLIFLLNKKT